MKGRQRDHNLENQARRAASGIALQVSEARRRAGRDRLHLWRVAAGSADELATALCLAEAWDYLDAAALTDARAVLDRVQAMLRKLRLTEPVLATTSQPTAAVVR